MAKAKRKLPPSPPMPPINEVVIPKPDFLKGRWVTSYSGWIHVDPKPTPNAPPQPPQIAGFDYSPATDRYAQRESYFVLAAMIILYLDGEGYLLGHGYNNRGGRDYQEYPIIRGDYHVDWDATIGFYGGSITTIQPVTGTALELRMDYDFIMKSRDEMELIWKWTGASYRGIVARATMTRIKPWW